MEGSSAEIRNKSLVLRVGKVQAWHSLGLVRMGDRASGFNLSQSTTTEMDEA